MSATRRRRGAVAAAVGIGAVSLAVIVAISSTPLGQPPSGPGAPGTAIVGRTGTSPGRESTDIPGPSPPAPAVVLPLPGAPESRPIPGCDASRQPVLGDVPAEPPAAGEVDLRLVGQLGGATDAATLDGDRLIAGAGDRVVAFDITQPESPRQVATSDPLPGSVTAVATSDDIVVVAMGDAGIAVLTTTGDRLTLAGHAGLPGYAEAVTIRGSTAYVADGPGGLRLLDLADPSTPREIGVAHDLHRILDVGIDGNHAYLAAADEGLLVVDIADPTAPSPIGGLSTGGYAFGISIDAGYAYLADGWGGLRAIDLSIPDAPRLASTVPTIAWMTGVHALDRRIHVAAGSDGLRVLDASDPGQPVDLGSLPLPGGPALRTTSDGNVAVVTDATHRLVLVDVGRPAEPRALSTFAPLATAQGVALVGDRLFLAARHQGVRVIDVSNPTTPRETAAIATEDPVMALTAAGANVFFSTIPTPGGRSVHSMFGVDGSADLHVEMPYAAGNTVGMATSGKIVLVGNESGLQVLDGSRPAPCELGFVQSLRGDRARASGVGVGGDTAYLAVEESGIHLIALGDLHQPAIVGTISPPAGIKGVHATLVAGQRLFAVASGHQGQVVLMYDVARPRAPRHLASLILPVSTLANLEDGVQPIAYDGGRLFVAAGSAGLVVVDVSAPRRMSIVGRLALPGRAASVVAADGLAYVALLDGGLAIVAWETASGATSLAGTASLARTLSLSGPASLAGISARVSPRPGAGTRAIVQAASDCVVTSRADAGSGTLRTCLTDAAAGSSITFDPRTFPARRPTTILLRSPLPDLVDAVTVDGEGAGVVVSGRGQVEAGLRLGGGNVIRNVAITGFQAHGISIDGSGNEVAHNIIGGNGIGISIQGPDNRIVGNFIGPDSSGRRVAGRQEIGVDLHDSGNAIGGPEPVDRNVIAGNGTEIWVKETGGNTVEGNYIGTDSTGTRLLRAAHSQAMYFEFGAGGNRIVGNVIAGPLAFGVDPGSSYNTVVGNLIGIDATGRRALGCECSGIAIDGGYIRIGGTMPGEGNLINGGLSVAGRDVVVLGNRFGVDKGGRPLAHPLGGIWLEAARRTAVGGRAAGAGNRIVGDVTAVRVTAGARSNVVIGNDITVARSDERDVGVRVLRASRNFLVANRIQGADIGVLLDTGAPANRVLGNVISGNGIGIDGRSSGNFIVGNALLRNRVAARDAGAADRWDDGARGNFWDDGGGADADGDGVLDRPRAVPPKGSDRFPLAEPP